TLRTPCFWNCSRKPSICVARVFSIGTSRRTELDVRGPSVKRSPGRPVERDSPERRGEVNVSARSHGMSIPRLVVVRTGTAGKAIVREHGDYPDWFNRALGADLPVVRADLGDALELPAGTHGVLVTGSPLSLNAPSPWMM